MVPVLEGNPLRGGTLSSDHESQEKHTSSCQPEKLAHLVISFSYEDSLYFNRLV